MKFESFLENQNRIYSIFKNSNVKSNGIIAHNLKGACGYFITFKHDPEITRKIDRFNQRISETAPAIFYDQKSIHTTLVGHRIANNSFPDLNELNRLAECVENVC